VLSAVLGSGPVPDWIVFWMPTLGGGDDVLGVGFPDEGAGLLVVVRNEAVDGLLQAD